MSNPSLSQMISQIESLSWPDRELTSHFLTKLGLHDIVDLEFTLNSRNSRERLAALHMIQTYLPQLTSGDMQEWKIAKETLREIYHPVESPDEEALL